MINSRINEHYNRQNTKEYLTSWVYQRRQIEKKLDDGYYVSVDEEYQDDLEKLMNKGSTQKGLPQQSRMPNGELEEG